MLVGSNASWFVRPFALIVMWTRKHWAVPPGGLPLISTKIFVGLLRTSVKISLVPAQCYYAFLLPCFSLHSFVRNMLYAYDEDKPWTSVGHRILATLWRVLQLRLILIVIFSSLFTKSGKFCQVSNAILN